MFCWTPQREFTDGSRTLTLKEECNKEFVTLKDGEWMVRETDERVAKGSTWKAIAEIDKWTWAVEDEAGNRFGVTKPCVEESGDELKRLNPNFRYVFHGKTLDGHSLQSIMKKAGDYLLADKKNRTYYFPQIVLAEGSKRCKEVLLTVDEAGIVTHTTILRKEKSNLYTHLPFFSHIASWNLLTNFQGFTIDANSEPIVHDESVGEAIGGWFSDMFAAIGVFIFKMFLSFVLMIALPFVAYCALLPLLYLMARSKGVSNLVINVTGWVWAGIWAYIFLLSLLYLYNSLWILVAFLAIGALLGAGILIHTYAITGYRCAECRQMGTKDVVETTVLCGVDVEADSTPGRLHVVKESTRGRIVKHRENRTDSVCSICRHEEHSKEKEEEPQEWQPLSEIACPSCGSKELEGTSELVEDTVKTTGYTTHKRGKIKDKGYSFTELRTKYESEDTTTHYSATSGYMTYVTVTKCPKCGYIHESRLKKDMSTGYTKDYQTKETVQWRRVD